MDKRTTLLPPSPLFRRLNATYQRSKHALASQRPDMSSLNPPPFRGGKSPGPPISLARVIKDLFYFYLVLTSPLLKHSLPNQLGKDLRTARKTQHLTQASLSHKTGLSIPAIRLLERTRGNLSSWHKVLEGLCLVLEGKSLPSADSVGARIALLRKRCGLGQRSFAQMIGISQPTLVHLERHSRGRVDTLERALLELGAGARLVSESSRTAFYAQAGTSSVHHGWQTPSWVLEILYAVFGMFDVDPCSSTRDRRSASVRARTYFTVDDNGLSRPWRGKVYVNPPYGRGIGDWTTKAKLEVEVGNAQVVVGLVPARTDTIWWHRDVIGNASIACLRGRLRFGNSEQSAPFPSALVVWGGTPAQLDALRKALPDAWHSGA